MRRRICLAALLTPLPLAAGAACSRPLRVPVAAIAYSITLDDGRIGGAYPELLRNAGPEAGCQFEFELMPRARVERMFEQGEADLLLAATRTDRRDQFGEFVSLVRSRPVLIGLDNARPRLHSLDDLFDMPRLRLVAVRGFDYGPRYRELLEQLRERRRLVMEADAAGVARALQAGLAEVTVMTPSILFGTLAGQPALQPLRARLRVEALEDLPWTEAGFYLSRRALTEADRQTLRQLLLRLRDSGEVWRRLRAHYPPGSLEGAMSPL